MKIVLFDPEPGGHHTEYAFHLARYLCQYGDSVSFLTWRNDPRWQILAKAEDVTFRYLVGDSGPGLGRHPLRRMTRTKQALGAAMSLANMTSADILHLLYLDHSEVATWMGLHLRKRPSASVVGTLWWPHFLHEDAEQTRPFRGTYHVFVASVLKHLYASGELGHLFMHSPRTHEALRHRLGEARHEWRRRTTLVPDPSLPPSKMSVSEARHALDIPEDRPVLLFFGALRAEKGPRILLDALPRIQHRCTVLLVGPPRDVGPVEIAKAQRGLDDTVRLLSRLQHVDEDDVPHYFAAADAVVLPYTTGFMGTSGVLQRAAASGTPVLATDVGDVGETVRVNTLGWVVEPQSPQALAQRVNEFLADPRSLTRVVAEPAKSYASRSSWRVCGRLIRDAYLDVVARRFAR